MESTVRTPEDQAILEALQGGIREIAAGLPMQFQAMAKPIMALILPQVESVSPGQLREFLGQARDKITALLGDGPPAAVESEVIDAEYREIPALCPPDTIGEWFDPATRTLTVRRPTVEDAEAIVDALECEKAAPEPDPVVLTRLTDAGAVVFQALQGASFRFQ